MVVDAKKKAITQHMLHINLPRRKLGLTELHALLLGLRKGKPQGHRHGLAYLISY